MNKGVYSGLSLGLALGLVLALTGYASLAQNAAKPPVKKKKAVSIVITQAPYVPPGEYSMGEIRGTVKNAPPGSRVVLWSQGDTWYVQPYASAPFTAISESGTFRATIHGGYEYAAFVVTKGYDPPATTSNLPKVGGSVLAMARKKPK